MTVSLWSVPSFIDQSHSLQSVKNTVPLQIRILSSALMLTGKITTSTSWLQDNMSTLHITDIMQCRSCQITLTTHTTLTMVIKLLAATFKCQHAHCMRCCLLELMHTTTSWTHTTLLAAINSTTVLRVRNYGFSEHYAHFKMRTTEGCWRQQLIRLD